MQYKMMLRPEGREPIEFSIADNSFRYIRDIVTNAGLVDANEEMGYWLFPNENEQGWDKLWFITAGKYGRCIAWTNFEPHRPQRDDKTINKYYELAGDDPTVNQNVADELFGL